MKTTQQHDKYSWEQIRTLNCNKHSICNCVKACLSLNIRRENRIIKISDYVV